MKKTNQNENDRHLLGKEKKLLTVMMVPHWEGKPKQFSIQRATVYSATGLLIVLILFLASVSTYLYHRSEDYRSAYIQSEQSYARLKEDFEIQDQELVRLNEYTQLVEREVRGLAELQSQVLDLVGLDSDEYASIEVAHQPVSRSGTLAFQGFRGDDPGPFGDSHQESILDSLLLEKRGQMESLLPELEDRLEYLDAQPNILPAEGRISSPFGHRRHPITGRMHHHDGLDIANQFNTPIYAAGSGMVSFSGYQPGYGRMVIIQHGYGYESLYAHNQRNAVSQGDRVEEGQLIAYVGSTGASTGPHVHFEVHRHGQPIDPKSLLRDQEGK